MPILSPHLFYQGLVHNGLIAWYDPGWQIITGQTGQTLIDRTSYGNNGQLGSAAGVDANDPAFSSGGITFGANDYVKFTQAAFDDLQQFTVITVFKTPTLDVNEHVLFNKNFRHFNVSGINGNVLRFAQNRAVAYDEWRSVQIVPQGNYIAAMSYLSTLPDNAPTMWINAVKQSITRNVTGTGAVLSDATFDLYIGNNSAGARSFLETIYVQLWYNRILSDVEYLQVYNYLRHLMAFRGVNI